MVWQYLFPEMCAVEILLCLSPIRFKLPGQVGLWFLTDGNSLVSVICFVRLSLIDGKQDTDNATGNISVA